jgi:hypothetical protein
MPSFPFFRAVDNRDIDSLRTLLDNGADPNTNEDGETILFMAVGMSFLKGVRLLLERGADKMIPVDHPELVNGLKNAEEAAVDAMDGTDEALAIGYLVADPYHKAVYQKKLATIARTNAFQNPGDNDVKEVAADALRNQNVREGIAPIVEKREKVLEKRGIMKALSGTPLPPDINDKIGTMVTGIRRKPKPGGRRFTRKQCKKFKCAKMGFTQKASCRPYKNCYKSRKNRK